MMIVRIREFPRYTTSALKNSRTLLKNGTDLGMTLKYNLEIYKRPILDTTTYEHFKSQSHGCREIYFFS